MSYFANLAKAHAEKTALKLKSKGIGTYLFEIIK